MWKNLGSNVTGFVGAAIENVQKISSDLEAQLDAAVAEDDKKYVKTSDDTPIKSQSTSELSSVGDVTTKSVSKTTSDGALSSKSNELASTHQPSPNKVKAKKTKARKKDTSITMEKASIEGKAGGGDENESSIELRSEKEVATSSVREIFTVDEAAPSSVVKGKKPVEIVEEDTVKDEANAKVKDKADRKKARVEAKKNKAAEEEEKKLQEEARQNELREERIKATEKKKLAEEKAVAEEEARLQQKKADEIARQVALREAKNAALLKKQADDAKLELVKQQETLDATALQHRLEIEKLENRIAEQELKQIELEHKNVELSSLLEYSRQDALNKIEQMVEAHKLEEEEWKVNMREACIRAQKVTEEKLQSEITTLSNLVDEQREKIELLEDDNDALKGRLAKRESELEIASKTQVTQLHEEIAKLSEVVSDRERALQTSTAQMSELTTAYEDSLSKITNLEESLNNIRSQAASSNSNSELESEIRKLQESMSEKDERLAAFEREGQALAKKQSEMEKNVRKSRQEVREKDNEIKKLKETKEQYVKTIEEMQEVIRTNESNSNSAQKHMSVMQAVSQASQDKLLKLEAELASKVDEIGVQKSALEKSWSEISDLKKIISELKAEKDDLVTQIGAGANKVVATETTRRELEQREAILRATNKQLQDSLQRQMNESVAREERMRNELNDTRQRWQEAVASREALASEVSGMTTPLLRQIATLQENLRVKSESWQKIESTLTERAIRAENLAETAEKKKVALEDEVRELDISLKTSAKKCSEFQQQVNDLEAMLDKAKRLEVESNDRIVKLQKSLNDETALRISLENTSREVDSRHRRAINDIRAEKEDEIKELEQAIGQLKSEISSYSLKLKEGAIKSDGDGNANAVKMKDTLSTNGSLTVKSPNFVTGNENSFAVSERSHQQISQRDEKIDYLNKQIQQIQLSRDALLDEVSFLSSKLSEYEELLEGLPQLRSQSKKLKEQNNTLLLMLGEKEEVLESTLQDMKDMKELYRGEIKKLLHIEDDIDYTSSVS